MVRQGNRYSHLARSTGLCSKLDSERDPHADKIKTLIRGIN